MVSDVWVLVLFVALFGVVLNVPVVKGDSGTIYIRADGSIDPPTAQIASGDNITYVLLADIPYSGNKSAIIVERNNTILDGAGHVVQGTGNGYETSGVAVSNRNNITIKDVKIAGFSIGIDARQSFGIGIYGNTITNTSYVDAIALLQSFHCTISGNNMTGNFGESLVHLIDSNNNTIEQNIMENNMGGCPVISLVDSSSNDIRNNVLTNQASGIWVSGGKRNVIFGNTITACTISFAAIWIRDGSDNKIYGNTIENNMLGIEIDTSYNTVFHNNFINNTQQAIAGWSNTWDDGYPSGGNYWSDYVIRYQNVTEIDDSGIWDTPYVITENNTDHYPLVNPHVVPEFPSFLILLLFMITTLLAIILNKKKHTSPRQ